MEKIRGMSQLKLGILSLLYVNKAFYLYLVNSNPSTGFSWVIPQILKGENRIYEISDTQYIPDEPKNEREREMTGRGGTEKVMI